MPFVQRLAPGMPVSVIRLFERRRGFIVNKKDEHAFSSWGSLLREEVRLANRERGCASRVLLDEKLLFMKAHPSTIEGYTQELSSPQAAVSFVAQGLANVAIGCTKDAKCSENLSGQHARKLVFVGLQTEYVDLVVAKRPDTERVLRFLKEACLDPCLKETLAKVEDFDREDGNARGSRSALGGGGALEGTSALEGRNARDGVREGKNTRGSGNSSSNKSAQERGRFTQNVPSEFSRMGSIVYEC